MIPEVPHYLWTHAALKGPMKALVEGLAEHFACGRVRAALYVLDKESHSVPLLGATHVEDLSSTWHTEAKGRLLRLSSRQAAPPSDPPEGWLEAVHNTDEELLVVQFSQPWRQEEFQALWHDLQRARTGWKILHLALDTVLIIASERDFNALVAEAAFRFREPPCSLITTLDEASHLLRRGRDACRRPSTVGALAPFVEATVRWVHNAVYGTGPLDHEAGEDPQARERLQTFVELCRQLTEDQRHPAFQRSVHLVESLAAPLGAVTCPAAASPGSVEHALDLWTRLHREAEDRRLTSELREALSHLATCLVAGPPVELDRLRNWLRLWLAYETVRRLRAAEDWRLLADTAYVVREALRYESHAAWRSTRDPGEGASAGRGLDVTFLFGLPQLQRALITLIDGHARVVARVPKALAVAGVLRGIGGLHDARSYPRAVALLHHVFDSYAFGHLLLACRLVPPKHGSPLTLGGALASSDGRDPGKDAFRGLRLTFSISVLFHDIGMLLMPSGLVLPPSLHAEIPALKKAFETLTSTSKTATDLDELWRADLKGTVDVPNAISGPARHGYLSAWLLHHRCKPLHATNKVTKDTCLAAVQAAILHAERTTEIEAHADPAAALLTLCDEVFEWDPELRGLADSEALGRSQVTVGPDLPVHRPRFRTIRLPDLRMARQRGDEGADDVVRPLLSPQGGSTGGPLIECELHTSGLLEQPPLCIWLTATQNLERLNCAALFGNFSPVLRIRGAVPSAYRVFGSTRRLFEAILDETGALGPLEGELAEEQETLLDWTTRLADSPDGVNESIDIEARGGRPFKGDIRRALSAVLKRAQEITDAETKLRSHSARGPTPPDRGGPPRGPINGPTPGPTGYTYDVYVIYADADQDMARELAQALQTRNLRVFWRGETIPLGGDTIEIGLQALQASATVVVLGTRSFPDGWISSDELARAIDLRRRHGSPLVIPLRQRDAQLPFGLAHIQGIELVDLTWGAVADRLAGAFRPNRRG
jgi:hypothetical protein